MTGRCRANMAHIRQSRPGYGLGFLVQVLKIVQGVPSWLGSGVSESPESPSPEPPADKPRAVPRHHNLSRISSGRVFIVRTLSERELEPFLQELG